MASHSFVMVRGEEYEDEDEDEEEEEGEEEEEEREEAAEPGSSSGAQGTVDPDLDLVILTFNCAEQPIEVDVLARQLQTRIFAREHDGLPAVLVLCLQEVAPVAWSLISPAFVKPNIDRFAAAVQQGARAYAHGAAAAASDGGDDDDDDEGGGPPPYRLLRWRSIGCTAIVLFERTAARAAVRAPVRVRGLVDAGIGLGYGAAAIGTKAAVALRFSVGPAELTVVAAHLAAMEWRLAERNAQWAALAGGLAFARADAAAGGDDEAGRPTAEEQKYEQKDEEEEASIYKSGTHLFVAGDLNYRIAATPPGPGAVLPSLDPAAGPAFYPRFLPRDQLTREREAGRTLNGLSEAAVRFPPTYKYAIVPTDTGRGAEAEAEACSGEGSEGVVPVVFATHRWPSWTDRILFRAATTPTATPPPAVRAYDALPLTRTSDHRAVFLRARMPLPLPLPSRRHSGVLRRRATAGPSRARAGARAGEVVVGCALLLWAARRRAALVAVTAIVGWLWWHRG